MKTVNIITSIIFLSILIVSCKKKDIEVMHTYPFKVETLPVLQTISSNDPIEIRCNLKVDDMYNKAIYTIRYFQYSGNGRVYIGSPESNPMYPNERYPLSIGSFRLYYIPYDKNDIEIEFVIEDNNGQTQKLNYSIKYQDNKKGGVSKQAHPLSLLDSVDFWDSVITRKSNRLVTLSCL